jgi:NADP-dependent 3-hydroxy acid dehydrogenase YdfG
VRDLTNKVAVVTGAASGIGLALVHGLLAKGMSVTMADVEEGALKEAADGLDRVLPVVTDVSDADAVEELAARTVREFGGVHVVCNNAGVSGTFGRVWAAPLEDWKWVFDVNVMGVVNGIRAFVPRFLEAGEGHVMNTASAASFEALPGMGVYAASKHAVLGLSEALKRELSASGANVGVTVLLPGGVVKSRIMSSERNWPAHLGAPPTRDDDPLPTMVRAGFTQAVDGGNDPSLAANAAIEGIINDAFLVCDETESLAQWGEHHADLGRGAVPVWPPT